MKKKTEMYRRKADDEGRSKLVKAACHHSAHNITKKKEQTLKNISKKILFLFSVRKVLLSSREVT
jgi:hypothetical protein